MCFWISQARKRFASARSGVLYASACIVALSDTALSNCAIMLSLIACSFGNAVRHLHVPVTLISMSTIVAEFAVLRHTIAETRLEEILDLMRRSTLTAEHCTGIGPLEKEGARVPLHKKEPIDFYQ